MNDYCAKYECRLMKWDVVYQLGPTVMNVKGTNGVETQNLLVELRNCNPIPDRGTSVYVNFFPAKLWIAFLVVLCVTVLLAAFFGFMMIHQFSLPGHLEKPLLVLAVFLILAEPVVLPLILTAVFKTREVQQYAIFRDRSDGRVLVNLNSAKNPDSSFGEFVETVIAAIKGDLPVRSRTSTPDAAVDRPNEKMPT